MTAADGRGRGRRPRSTGFRSSRPGSRGICNFTSDVDRVPLGAMIKKHRWVRRRDLNYGGREERGRFQPVDRTAQF